MAAQLEKERELQPLATQFVLLKLDTGTREWAQWQSRFKHDGSGEPIVFVVRADGETLYARTGKPSDLSGFLEQRLTAAGKVLTVAELREIEKAAKDAAIATKRNDIPAAVELAVKYGETGSYAQAAVALSQLRGELEAQAAEDLAAAEEKLQSERPDEQFEGALALVQLQRRFSGLPAAAEAIDPIITKYRDDPHHPGLIARAEAFDAASALEEDRKWSEALAAFQKIATEHPNTPAARLAGKRIPDLEKRAAIAAGEEPGENADKPASSGDEKKAASLLRLGELILDRNREKAREYFERAIEAAPESDAADKARILLEKL
jgi:tetratricopeptide (TPR) repeat protein